MKKYFPLLFIFLLSGCAALEPYIRNYNVISVDQEAQLGQQAATQVQNTKTLVENAQTKEVRDIGQKLVNALPRKDFAYHFYVVQDDTPNAFTIPGGSIYVHTGLLKMADRNELAGVMAHEVGHAFERHPAKSLSLQLGVENLSQMLFKNNQGQIKTLALQLAKGSFLNHYGREDEFEADEVGYLLLKRAGMPTGGLVSFFSKLQNLERGGFAIPFLSTHPPTPERIARLQALDRGQLQPTISLSEVSPS